VRHSCHVEFALERNPFKLAEKEKQAQNVRRQQMEEESARQQRDQEWRRGAELHAQLVKANVLAFI